MLQISKSQNIKEDILAFLKDSGKLGKLTNSEHIVIKPNFAMGEKTTWEDIYITDKKLLESVTETVLELNKTGVVYIAEGDSIGFNSYEKFEHLGLPDRLILKDDNIDRVQILDVSRDRQLFVKNKKFKFFSEHNGWLHLSNTVTRADFLISLSNLKTHILCKYSGACKNLYGLIGDSDKQRYHGNLNEVIHDINSIIKPDINIIDGFRGMQGNGPIYGEHINFGMRIISDNASEADFFAAGLVGIDPRKIKYLKYLNPDSCDYNIPDPAFKIVRPSLPMVLKYFIKQKLIKAGNWLVRLGY